MRYDGIFEQLRAELHCLGGRTGMKVKDVVDVMQENHLVDPEAEIQRLLVALGP